MAWLPKTDFEKRAVGKQVGHQHAFLWAQRIILSVLGDDFVRGLVGDSSFDSAKVFVVSHDGCATCCVGSNGVGWPGTGKVPSFWSACRPGARRCPSRASGLLHSRRDACLKPLP
jgi:hypothetical protein